MCQASKGAGESSRAVRAQVPQKPAPDIKEEEVVQDTKTEVTFCATMKRIVSTVSSALFW